MLDRTEVVKGLRELADIIEHSDIELPDTATYLYVFVHTVEELAQAAKLMKQAEKSATDDYYNVRRNFGLINLEYTIARSQVCTARIVGTETVIRDRIVVPAVVEKITEQRDKVEWDCPKSLLALIAEKDATE